MQEMSSRSLKIDALRGFAIFMVVLGHSIIYFPLNLHETDWCQQLFLLVSSIHMPLFFLLSGFCWQYKGTYKEYIVKKIKRLLIPYIIFNLLDIVPRALLTEFVNRSRDMGSSVERIIFNGGEYWFLYTLLLIFIFFPFIARLISKGKKAGFLAALVIFMMKIIGTQNTMFCINQVCAYLVFFYLGYIIKRYQEASENLYKKITNEMKAKQVVLCVLAVAIVYGSLVYGLNQYRLGSLIAALIGILSCYIMSGWKWFTRIFARFGKYSLPIYLLNEYLLVISRTIICSVLHIRDPLAIICFNMLVDFIMSYLFIKYVCCRMKIGRIVLGME